MDYEMDMYRKIYISKIYVWNALGIYLKWWFEQVLSSWSDFLHKNSSKFLPELIEDLSITQNVQPMP